MRAAFLETEGRLVLTEARMPGIQSDDQVLIQVKTVGACGSEVHAFHGTHPYRKAPFLTGEAVRWLVSRDIKMLGIDTRGSMDPATPDRQNHLPVFEAGLVYIENLTNLEALPESRVTVAALPPAVEGLEGLPVRVVAFL